MPKIDASNAAALTTGETRIKGAHKRTHSRIQDINRQKILDAATKVFADYGYHGATLDQVGDAANMSKPNLLYYYSSKEELYATVLERILDIWLLPLKDLDVTKSPEHEIGAYIDEKLEHSRLYPEASRVWSNEMTAGAPKIKPILETYLKDLCKKRARTIRTWAREGKVADISPYHLLFMIWAVTQHYADFAAQIESMLGKSLDDKRFFNEAKKNVKNILMHGFLGRTDGKS